MSDKKESGKIVIVLRCPFCDSLAIKQGFHSLTFKHWVKCEDCGAIGPSGLSQQEALGKWNKRRYCPGTYEDGEVIGYEHLRK